MFNRSIVPLILFLISLPAFAVEAGDKAPAFTGQDENGEQVTFPGITKGKPTVMVFWATWCPYCRAFMPYLGEIQKDYGKANINVVLVNHKERGAGDPAAYTRTLDFDNVSVMDGDAIGDAYSIDFIPGLLIVDADGTVAWRRKSTDLPAGKTVSELWDSQVRAELDRLL
ncbi:MAG: TlpA disulfide reductase family protein [Woeseia sp.]